jgi:MFS family permease
MMTEEKRDLARHNTRLLNFFALCQGAIFILPVLLPYYSDRIGLGFRELMAGEAVFAAIIILMEIPTGWLADRWKRKYVLALAGAMGFCGYFLLSQAGSFFETVVAQGTIGVAVSLVSGTMAALHYDSLLAAGTEDEYRRQEGRRHGLGMMSVGLSSLAGGFLYSVHPELPIIGTLITGMGMFVCAMLMREPERHRAAGRRNPFAAMAETVKYALHGHREIAEIILASAALFGTTKMMMWAQQPYYTAIGLDEKWFGVLMAGGFLTGAMASHLGHLLDHRFRNRSVLLAMTGAVAVLCVASAMLHNIYGAILLIAGSLCWGVGWPLVQDAINQRAESHRRAMILSTASLMIHMMFIPLSLMVGAVADARNIETAVLGLAMIPVMAAFLLLRVVLRDRKLEKTALFQPPL